jgi:hypothetical protein
LRLYATGVANTAPATISIRVGGVSIPVNAVVTGGTLVEPGVYTIDFRLPGALNMAGDQPIIVTVTVAGVTFTSRLDDTAPRLFIL